MPDGPAGENVLGVAIRNGFFPRAPDSSIALFRRDRASDSEAGALVAAPAD
jgi:hypothetical protein